MSENTSLKHRVKSLVEHALGVHITRNLPNQWTDAVVARLRKWNEQDVVFDVGANDGRTIIRLQEHLPSPRIFAFEPVSATFQVLQERTRDMKNVRCFQLALGAEAGRQEIYLNPVASTNSFSREWAPSTGSETVEISTVDAVMAEQKIDFVHFLKIDTEGFEMEVLKGADRALRESRIGIVQVEVGFDQMQSRSFATLEQVRQHLAPMGYRLQGIYNQCCTNAKPPQEWTVSQVEGYRPRVLVYCDALFVRADLAR